MGKSSWRHIMMTVPLLASAFTFPNMAIENEPENEVVTQVSRRSTTPTPTLTREQEFLMEMEEIMEDYEIDLNQWELNNTKTAEERTDIFASNDVGPDQFREYIEGEEHEQLSFFLRNMIGFYDDFLSDTPVLDLRRPYTQLVIYADHPRDGIIIRGGWREEDASLKSYEAPNGDLYINLVNEKEGRDFLFSKISEVKQKLNEVEAAAEISLEETLEDSFWRLFRLRTTPHVEFEDVPLMSLIVYRRADKIQIRQFYFEFDGRSIPKSVEQRLDELFSSYPEYAYMDFEVGGVATIPSLVFVNGRLLTNILDSAAHETLHHVFGKQPVGQMIDGEEWHIINESLATMFGRVVVRDIVKTDYANHDETYQGYLDTYFEEDGTYRDFLRAFSTVVEDPVERGIYARYGASDLGVVIEDLYNCIGNPYIAFRFFKNIESSEDIIEALERCQSGENLLLLDQESKRQPFR